MLNGGQKFSKMDLSDAYMQLELEAESKKYTTINTHKGMFEVLKRLREAGFRLKRGECEFLKEEMEGVRPSPKKVQAMVNMPEPKNLKEVESFIGMLQYYGKFIPNSVHFSSTT
ncbi:hypothetical protein COOONC_03164 [Cooperia oncophora]